MSDAVAYVALALSLLALAFSLRPPRQLVQTEDPLPDPMVVPTQATVMAYGMTPVTAEEEAAARADAAMVGLPVYFGRYGATRAKLHALSVIRPENEEPQ